MHQFFFILMILANSYPILNFNIAGNSQDDHMITGILSLSVDGYYPLAALVFFSAIAAPTLHLLVVWYLSAACILNQKWPGTPQLLGLAQKYGKSPAQIILRWALQLGVSTIPKSANPIRLQENFDVFDFVISEADMAFMATFNEDYRVVPSPMSML
jgi:diketogulonate reductase-like aldo/keto reductase